MSEKSGRQTDRQTDSQTHTHTHTDGANHSIVAHFVRGNYNKNANIETSFRGILYYVGVA